MLLLSSDAARAQQDTATAAIRAAIRSYAEALERGDGKALEGFWTPDGDIVDDEGRVLNGRERLAVTPLEGLRVAADGGSDRSGCLTLLGACGVT